MVTTYPTAPGLDWTEDPTSPLSSQALQWLAFSISVYWPHAEGPSVTAGTFASVRWPGQGLDTKELLRWI